MEQGVAAREDGTLGLNWCFLGIYKSWSVKEVPKALVFILQAIDSLLLAHDGFLHFLDFILSLLTTFSCGLPVFEFPNILDYSNYL